MKIYNTLSKRKEEFVPLEEGKVKMYVCGPTVYNFIHIGNARPMIAFDTVRRYFEYKGFEVNFVSNFTDVDDKIIKKAIEEGVSADEISKRYIAECKKDMEAMNVKPATKNPLATEEICGMVEMISTLIEKGYAYEKNGTVYYRTRKFEGYGKLSHKNLDDLRSGGRSLLVTGEDEKEDPLDFVLWKPKKEGEPAWESPWSEGRPGWHIECSEMSKKYLGEQIDIHAGGEDLVFPHHENEIAQSEAANGKEFAKYWMHNGFLNIDNKKMSKSLGNFFTVREIGEKYDLQILRFFMLSAHYRSPLNFSAELMEAAKNGLERIVTAAEHLKFLLEGEEEIGSPSLYKFCADNKKMLKADIILVSDTSMISMQIPSITCGLRGLTYMEVEVTGPNKDLHSGLFGGAVANPANVLARMVASLIDENGHVTIPGFYDDVRELTAAERKAFNKAPFNLTEYKKALEIGDVEGEAGFTTIERTGIRPSLDVNGIWGGYIEEGTKTVIPSKASAKISMRLVPGQDFKKIAKLFEKHFKAIAPKSVKVKVKFLHGGMPYVAPTDMPAYKAAEKAIADTFGKKPLPFYSGGSIPIISGFENILGIKSLLIGFGLAEDAIHSPNESYGLDQFYKGVETIPLFYKYFAEK